MSQTKTCGPMFLSLLESFASDPDTSSDPVRLFSAGHMAGQAEKIYLGACSAAMFRPSSEHFAWMKSALNRIAPVYDLNTGWLRYEGVEELWLVRGESSLIFERLTETDVNSPEWHVLRGLLCGVPFVDIDTAFHARKGYAAPCDRPKEAQNV